MADVNPGLAAQAEDGATVIGVNPNAIVQEELKYQSSESNPL